MNQWEGWYWYWWEIWRRVMLGFYCIFGRGWKSFCFGGYEGLLLVTKNFDSLCCLLSRIYEFIYRSWIAGKICFGGISVLFWHHCIIFSKFLNHSSCWFPNTWLNHFDKIIKRYSKLFSYLSTDVSVNEVSMNRYIWFEGCF